MSDLAHAHADPHGHAHAHHPAQQHHFDTLTQQHEASTLGMWLFLITEVMFFGGLFMAYMLYRVWYPEAWAEGSLELDTCEFCQIHGGSDLGRAGWKNRPRPWYHPCLDSFS